MFTERYSIHSQVDQGRVAQAVGSEGHPSKPMRGNHCNESSDEVQSQ